MSQDIIVLSERIKELTHSSGTGSLNLDGAVAGFSAFGDYYSYNDAIYYAVTDGTDYEVGSGQYILDGSDNALTRFPSQSTNSDGLVNFSAGVKEVYVTYPGKFSVYSASGLSGFDQPQASGLAFWGSPNIVDYDSDLIWDKTNSRMGVGESSPQYAIHIGGSETYSQIYSSGSIVGDSGVLFAGIDPAYSGGRQLEPFIRSELNTETGTDGVFALSGLVDQVLLFNTQTEGTVLAGPPSGCSSEEGCPENYPVFRALVADDIPDLYSIYVTPVSGWADSTMTARDTALSDDIVAISGSVINSSGLLVLSDIIESGNYSPSSVPGALVRASTTNANNLYFSNGTNWITVSGWL